MQKQRKIINIFISILLFLSMVLYLPSRVFSETVILKSGRRIRGNITEQTDKYIKIDFMGVELTYWLDEVERIQSESDKFYQPKGSRFGFGADTARVSQKSFLWKVRSSTNTAYILGSMHFAKSSLYPLDKKIEDAFRASDILAVEADVNKLDFFENLVIIDKGMYPPPETLKKHLSPNTYLLASKRLQDMGLDISQFDMHKPWFLAMQLVGIELMKLGFDPNYGIDMHFLRKAEGNKEILELESIEYQIDLLDSLTEKEQDLFLFSTLVDLDIIGRQTNKIIKAWQEGDVNQMEEVLRKGLLKYPEIAVIYDKVIFRRNKNMALKIEEFLRSGDDYFIIVGAAHLVGEEGIIQTLEEKGYFLKQL